MTKVIDIVGIQHRKSGLGILSKLEFGTDLYLLPEPQNLHDRNAVLVLVPLGYVRASQAAKLSPKMQSLCLEHLKAQLIYAGEYNAEAVLSEPLQKDLFHDL